METPKYIYTEQQGTANVSLTVPADEHAIAGMESLLVILKRLSDRIAKDLEELKKKV